MSEELTREEMEKQLMQGEFAEDEELEEPLAPPESPETEVAEPEEAAPEISFDELRERLSKLETELEHRSGALAEERDKRRNLQNQHDVMMEAIREARERQAQQVQSQPQTEEDEVYNEYIQAWEKKYREPLEALLNRINGLEQFKEMVQTTYQMQAQTQSFASASQKFAQANPDYDEAMTYLVDRVRQEADIFYSDPQQKEQFVQYKANQMIYYPPEQLYKYAQYQGYTPKQGQPQPSGNTGKPGQPKPKSLAAVAGATGNVPSNWQAKAQKVVDASYQDLANLPIEELDNLLKSMK